MAKIERLTNVSGETVYPRTLATAVSYDETRTMSALAVNGLYTKESDGVNTDDEIVSIDANTLQGHGPDYFAKADDVSGLRETFIDELAKHEQLKPEFANSVVELNEKGDTTKLYVLPDNMIWAYTTIETEVETEGYHNLLESATADYNSTTIYGEDYNGDGHRDGYLKGVRLSSSGSTSTQDGMLATGFIPASDGARIRTVGFDISNLSMSPYVISYNSSGTKLAHKAIQASSFEGDHEAALAYITDFTLDSATYGTGIAFIRISASANGNMLPSIVTVNEEIKEGNTETIITKDWTNTGHAFVPADYEYRIVELEAEVETLNKQLKKAKVSNLAVSEVFAPSPQLPADGSETADFNGIKEYITPEAIFAKIDELLKPYPRYITKEIMGKDASGNHDWCRYTLCKRAYDAWQKPNHPPMYAWVNGSTTIYSVSVSPRIGDKLYTTTFVGTETEAVTAVSNANQTRTINNVEYIRDKSKDIEPTLVFTETSYSPYFSANYSTMKKEVYDGNKAVISTIATMTNGILTTGSGETYIRYPLGDRSSKFERIPAIVIGGNEHGTDGDPATPAMINARLIKDLCECKNANNPLLNLLKNEYMMVFCPVVNPWGLHKDNQNIEGKTTYCNFNGVNIDRNFDTPGWHVDKETTGGCGEYGGSEIETQYFMNTLVASKCKIGMCNHSYGHGLDKTGKEAVSAGICSYMFGNEKPKYKDSLLKIAEVMAANYNLVFGQNGVPATPTKNAKTRSYIEWIGADAVALEMNSREGFITEGQGAQFTAKVMEAAYTQLLQVLYMMIDCQ